MPKQTLYDKLWQQHLAHCDEYGSALIYVDRHPASLGTTTAGIPYSSPFTQKNNHHFVIPER